MLQCLVFQKGCGLGLPCRKRKKEEIKEKECNCTKQVLHVKTGQRACYVEHLMQVLYGLVSLCASTQSVLLPGGGGKERGGRGNKGGG